MWIFITNLFHFRVLLRLALFQTTGQRMTLQPTHLQRDVDPASLVASELKQTKNDGWIGKRTGVAVPSIKRDNADVSEYLLSKVLTPEKIRKPKQMVQVQKNISKIGELLYIFRPLLYGK
jgi:peroxin-16